MTPHGLAYINSPSDAGAVCRNFVSEDFARYIENNLTFIDREKLLAKEKAQTDAEAMEGEIEAYRNMLFEVQSVVEQLMVNEWEKKKKVSTKNIYEKLEWIDNYIQKNL